MTSASLQPLTDKDAQNRHPASHSELFLLCQCRDDPDSFGGEKQRERRNGSVMFEGGDLPSQLNCSGDRQCCVRNSERKEKGFYLLLFCYEVDSQRNILRLRGCSFRRLLSYISFKYWLRVTSWSHKASEQISWDIFRYISDILYM